MFDQAAAPIVPPSAMPTAGIGAPMPRPDGHAKVTGSARYAGEEAGPGTLHAVMVLSSIASGQVKGDRSGGRESGRRRVRGADPRGAARYTNAARRKILAASGMHLLVSQTGTESVQPSELRPLKSVQPARK